MSESLSQKVHESWREAAQKYDYFLTGLCAALAGFIAQGFQGSRIGFNPGTAELVALLCLIGAVASGLRRIESTVELQGQNQLLLRLHEEADVLNRAAAQEPRPRVLETNEPVSEVTLREAASSKREVGETLERDLKDLQARSSSWYAARTRLLLAGLLLLAVSRVWKAYT